MVCVSSNTGSVYNVQTKARMRKKKNMSSDERKRSAYRLENKKRKKKEKEKIKVKQKITKKPQSGNTLIMEKMAHLLYY